MDQLGTASQHLSADASKGSAAHVPNPSLSLASDILYGADAIAKFVHGAKSFRRSIYNLVETNRIPHFRIGAIICARKSVLLAWITAQETAGTKAGDEGGP
jgi:hypothetical protein